MSRDDSKPCQHEYEGTKGSHLLGELSNLWVNVVAVQEIHFICIADARVVGNDFIVFSAHGSRCSAGVSLDVALAQKSVLSLLVTRLTVVADVAVKSLKFWVAAVYVPNTIVKRHSFFKRLGPFLDDSKRLVLMSDWNAILDPNINKIGRDASVSDMCESSLIDLLTEHDLVERLHLDNLRRDMWTWLNSSPFDQIRSYLDSISLESRHWIRFLPHIPLDRADWLVRPSLRLANRSCYVCFARLPDIPIQDFLSYLADFPHFQEAQVAGCEGLVTECKVRDALKQVGFKKSPELDGLPYEMYLSMPHMIVPILTDMFNHWFAQIIIPGSISKGVILLLKKDGKHVWEELDDYRPITLLDIGLKILAWVLANWL